MTAIFDCFTFFNELDLLEVRLNELDEVVDYFVIVESEETFTGNPKPYVLEDNYDRFSRFHSKIIYIKMGRQAEGLRSWTREHAQRSKLIDGLENAGRDDIVLLSDVDEIVSADAVRRIRHTPPATGEVYCLEQRYFMFYFNLELPINWLRTSPRAVRFDTLTSMSSLRSIRPRHDKKLRDLVRQAKAMVKMRRATRRTTIPGAGWHFSWLGGIDRVTEKAKSISTHANLPKDLDSRAGAQNMIDNGLANYRIRDLDESFPKVLVENREKYRDFLIDAE